MPLDSKEMTARTHLSSRNHNEHFHFIFLKEMCPYFHSFLPSSVKLLSGVSTERLFSHCLHGVNSLLVYCLLPTYLVPLLTTFFGAVLTCRSSSDKRSP